jgi:hypothetical protein
MIFYQKPHNFLTVFFIINNFHEQLLNYFDKFRFEGSLSRFSRKKPATETDRAIAVGFAGIFCSSYSLVSSPL